MTSTIDRSGHPPQRNPFSTANTRPGAIPFHFPAGTAAVQLVEQLRQQKWWGEIVGPHGSGKSTLIATLRPILAKFGRDVECFTLHRGEKRLPISNHQPRSWKSSTQVVVDGFEQMSFWRRMALKRTCNKRRTGLLVVTHTSVGLPSLFGTRTTPELAQRLVMELTAGDSMQINPEDVRRSYDRHQANLRETFFELYDVYELRKRG